MRVLAYAATILFSGVLSGCVLVLPDTCNDGLTSSSETDTDCGGVCGACATGRRCVVNSDCVSGFCSPAGRCAVPGGNTCSNGVWDSGEVDVDCGGTCSACVGGHPSGSGTSSIPVNASMHGISPGQPTVIEAGVRAGYGITCNTGGSYRLVWAGNSGATTGNYSEFYGSIWTTGTFSNIVAGTSVSSYAFEVGDVVGNPANVSGGQRLDFDAFSFVGADGIDFVASDPVYFDLFIDGVRPSISNVTFPSKVAQDSSPAAIPFALTQDP